MRTTQISHLISLLVVVPLQVVEDGGPHQQVGEGDDDEGEGANLWVMVFLIISNQVAIVILKIE